MRLSRVPSRPSGLVPTETAAAGKHEFHFVHMHMNVCLSCTHWNLHWHEREAGCRLPTQSAIRNVTVSVVFFYWLNCLFLFLVFFYGLNFWLGGQDARLGGLCPPLPIAAFGLGLWTPILKTWVLAFWPSPFWIFGVRNDHIWRRVWRHPNPNASCYPG